jgi:hypothetical protein
MADAIAAELIAALVSTITTRRTGLPLAPEQQAVDQTEGRHRVPC